MNSNNEPQLAIATVPVQKTDLSNLYNPKEALCLGTIFPELNKPFFVTEAGPKQNNRLPVSDKEKLLNEIMELDFVLKDLTLYLDTHSEDTNAYNIYLEHLDNLKQLKQSFATKYYPLTESCIPDVNNTDGRFAWTLGPAPWEGVCE